MHPRKGIRLTDSPRWQSRKSFVRLRYIEETLNRERMMNGGLVIR